MADRIPGLAAADVAKLLTTNVKRLDGKDAGGFNSQAAGLKAMRSVVLEHDVTNADFKKDLDAQRAKVLDLDARVDALEARPASPFPGSG